MAAIFRSTPALLDQHQSVRLFNWLFVCSQCFGIGSILAVSIWMGAFKNGGYAWGANNPAKEFHYHPTFMVIALLFLQGEAIMVYRVFRNERKRFTKLLHMSIHSVVIVLAIVALKAVWDSHDLHRNSAGDLEPMPNLVSLHSWLGISAVCFYLMQYAIGFLAFLWPGLSVELRRALLPLHQLAGVLCILWCTCTALMGISENAAWHNTCWTVGRQMCAPQFVSNLLGICLLGYCACVLLLVLNPRWKRRPLPEEECLSHVGGGGSLLEEEDA